MSDAAPTVHLVDDDASFRTALGRLLRAAGYATREYASAGDFLLSPPGPEALGCVLLDMRMPGPSGLELQQAINRSRMALPVIFLSGHGDLASGVRAMKSGALDFLAKPVEGKVLLPAVENAIARCARAIEERRELAALRARYASLSERERQVFHAVVSGRLNKQTAADIGAAERTVKAHRAAVMEKMGAASLPELVQIASRLSAAPD